MIRIPLFRGLVALTACVLVVGCSDSGEEPGTAAPTTPFNAERAHDLLEQQVAFGPRVPGTPGHQRQLEWMLQYLRARADTVIRQPFTHVAASGDTLRMTNLFARFRPEASERILLVAHWDTRPLADQSPDEAGRAQPVPGANDGASGTAVLLELAEMFRRDPPPIGVDLLLVDGEDYGPDEPDMYLGAKHFVRNLPPGYSPLYGVLLDMVGDQSPRFPVEGHSAQYAPEVVRRIWELAAEMGYGDVFVDQPGGYITDDHVPLNQGGIRTVDVIDFDYGHNNRFWHTPQDLPENTSAESLGIVGNVIAELVRRGG